MFPFALIPGSRKEEDSQGSKPRGNSPKPAPDDRIGSPHEDDNMSVLVADESHEFGDVLSRLLRSMGLHCILVDDADIAYSEFLKRDPRITILSYSISRKEDGVEAAKSILHADSDAKVMVLINWNTKVSEKAERVGVELFMDKAAGLDKIANAAWCLLNLKKPTSNLITR